MKKGLTLLCLFVVLVWGFNHIGKNSTVISVPSSKRLLLETNHLEVFDNLPQSKYLNQYVFATSPLRPYQCQGFVYIPDLMNETYRESVVERLNKGLDVCFIGSTTIQKLEDLLGMDLGYNLKVNEWQEGSQGMNLFYQSTLTFEESNSWHSFPKDLSFDLLVYNTSGENLLVASILSEEKDYKNLFLCIAEETLDHPEAYHTSISGNVQYRFYHDVKDNTYFAYDISIYHEINIDEQKQGYSYVYHGYFSQRGKTLLNEIDGETLQQGLRIIPPFTFAHELFNGYVESYSVWLDTSENSERRYPISKSKVFTERGEGNPWQLITTFTKKDGYYDQNDILHPSFYLVVEGLDEKDPLDLLEKCHVKIRPIFG